MAVINANENTVARPNFFARVGAAVVRFLAPPRYAEQEKSILMLDDVELAKRGLDRDMLVALSVRGLY